MSGPCISIQVNAKRYSSPSGSSRLVLDDLSFDVAPGEFVCVIGPSGAGKSTLLRLLAGIDGDFSGSIRPASMFTRVAGVAFQEPRLMPWLDVINNVVMGSRRPGNDEVRRAKRLLERLGLEGSEDRYPATLSVGMQRRVALARALLPQPDVLLLDEPFASLDAPVARVARDLLAEECDRLQASVIMFTHDLREAAALADSLVFLSAPPACVALRVPGARGDNRDANEVEVERFCRRLLQRYPRLLSGDANRRMRAVN